MGKYLKGEHNMEPATSVLSPMEVIVFPATKTKKDIIRKKKIRVAAYCRVSTDDEEQLTSYTSQIEYYTQKISNNKDWKLVGIFADEGITGVTAKKREQFMDMIELCREGKIDMILTKSISRFSRNIADSINYVRELKNINVSVIFEKENIDTGKMTSEMILALHSIFAQAESESISNNVKMGKRFGYKTGRVPMQYGSVLGYKKGEDGNPEIIPEEAAIIELIYTKFLNGWSLEKISQLLEEKGYKTVKGNTKWSKATIRRILTNEKYKGDVLMQKTYVVDLFTHKTVKNTGELPMYLAKNHHVPIIDREVWDMVQVELARRNNLKPTSDNSMTLKARYSSKYALTGLIECGDCGSKYRRTTWSKRGKKKVVWRCINRLEHGTTSCTKSPTIEEDKLHATLVNVINSMMESKDKLRALLSGSIAEILSSSDSDTQIIKLKSQIDEKNTKIIDFVKNGVEMRESRTEIEERCKEQYNEIQELQKQLNITKANRQLEHVNTRKLQNIMDRVSKIDGRLEHYDDEITRAVITGIKIISEKRIEVILFGTVVMEAEL